MRHGLVQETRSKQYAACSACDDEHPVTIAYDPVFEAMGWHCPEAGFVAASASDVEAVRALPEKLASVIAEALECIRTRSSPLIIGQLWRIGAFEVSDNDVSVYLALRLVDAEDASEIAKVLSTELTLRNWLILTPKFSGSSNFRIAECRVAQLSDLISLSESSIHVSKRRALELAGVQIQSASGRPAHALTAEVDGLLQGFVRNGDVFASKRKVSQAVETTLKNRFGSAPGRTMINRRIAELSVGPLLVRK